MFPPQIWISFLFPPSLNLPWHCSALAVRSARVTRQFRGKCAPFKLVEMRQCLRHQCAIPRCCVSPLLMRQEFFCCLQIQDERISRIILCWSFQLVLEDKELLAQQDGWWPYNEIFCSPASTLHSLETVRWGLDTGLLKEGRYKFRYPPPLVP